MVFLIAVLSVPVGADPIRFDFNENISTTLSDPDLSGAAEFLPDGASDELAEYLSSNGKEDKAKAVSDKLDPGYWGEFILNELKESLLSGAGILSTVLGLIIISSVISAFSDGSTGELSRAPLDLTSLLIALEVARASSSVVTTVSEYLTRLCSLMNVMTPVMSALYVTSGRVTEMSVNSSALMLFVTLTENVNTYILLPFAAAVLALTTVAALGTGGGIPSFANAAGKALTFIIASVAAVFSFVMGVQTALARGTDTLAAKAVKFAVGSGVPIVGGAMSEAVTTVGASLSLIKKTAGGAGVVMILLILVPVLIRVAAVLISLSLCKGAAELAGADAAASVISGARSALSAFAALAASAGILFLFAVTLFMNSSVG